MIVLVKRAVINQSEAYTVHNSSFLFLHIWFIDTLLLFPLLTLSLEYLLPPSLYHYFVQAMGGKAGRHIFWNQLQ
eukprot:9740670-Ditylum_brightwellii.AAC.1